jgi:hypothetical protein
MRLHPGASLRMYQDWDLKFKDILKRTVIGYQLVELVLGSLPFDEFSQLLSQSQLFRKEVRQESEYELAGQ